MQKRLWGVLTGLCVLAVVAVGASPSNAQTAEIKEKPAMYTYVGNWAIPRPQWADMEKSTTANQKLMEKNFASGTIVAYGTDVNLTHTPDGATHDDWWSAMSLAGLLNVLDQAYKSGNATTPVLASATRHWDEIFVSRYYNWHSGSWKDVYTHGSVYKLKAGAPNDAVDQLSKNLVVPLMEKLLADGTIHEYEVDTEAVHTDSPDMFFIFYIAANAEGLDKVNAALRDAMKANPLGGPAFASMVDSSAHRDEIARSNATYK